MRTIFLISSGEVQLEAIHKDAEFCKKLNKMDALYNTAEIGQNINGKMFKNSLKKIF